MCDKTYECGAREYRNCDRCSPREGCGNCNLKDGACVSCECETEKYYRSMHEECDKREFDISERTQQALDLHEKLFGQIEEVIDPTLYDLEMKEAPGTKHDRGKLRLDLIDPLVMEYLALALGYGAGKYGEDNWLKGMQWSRVYGGLLRHLRSWYMGHKIDDESGNPHLAHALAMLQFLVRYSADERYKEFDDRLFKRVV